MKFAYHCELRDNPYPTYLVYTLDLYDHEDLKNISGPGLIGKVVPQGYGGSPFLGVVDT